jgi:NAD(P)-dependent dehydrogenase (short-subunit alcohol dehydrogenase family)
MERNHLLVGGNSGIGAATVEHLLEHDPACRLWIVARRPGSWPVSERIRFQQHDVVADGAAGLQLPEHLHGLVYFPGSISLKPFDRLRREDFQDDLAVNLHGAVAVIQAALAPLKAGSGSIVLFSSVAAGTGLAFHASIAAAKGAVEGLARALAAELAPAIRVNAIAPALTDTPLAARLLDSEEKRAAAARRHPLERVGQADEIAGWVALLLGDAARSVTGQVIAIDGGMSSVRRL